MFQFHKGSIKTAICGRSHEERPGFNSTKVRLRRWGHQIAVTNFQFQFHKGSIKTSRLRALIWLRLCFNSTKVRLRRRSAVCYTCRCRCFNSTKVRLRLDKLLSDSISLYSFNSTKVRLRLRFLFRSSAFRLFQFHKGSIKTPLHPHLFRGSAVSIPQRFD